MKQFVYSFLLVVVALLGAPTLLFSQCVPLDSIPGDAIIDPLPFTEDNPGSGILDTACVGEDFVTVFNIEVPEMLELNGTMVTVDSIVVQEDGVSGLPAGLSASYNPESRTFLPNTTGCIQVSGVPEAGQEGEYLLTIDVTLFANGILFGLNFTLPDGDLVPGEYNLVVRENGNPACQPSSISEFANDKLALEVYPNPANNLLKAKFSTDQNFIAQILLIDAFGRQVKQVAYDAYVGGNEALINVSELPVGFYTLLITDRSNPRAGVSQRVMINR